MQTHALAPRPGSSLYRDDELTHPYRLSNRALMAITSAVDNLRCVRSSLLGERIGDQQQVMLHLYGQMAQLRFAVENAPTAVVLLGLGDRLDRVTYRLMLEWNELRPHYRLRELLGSMPPRTMEQREQQLVDMLAAARNIGSDDARKILKKRLAYEAIVRAGGEVTPDVGADMAELAWRMGSGLGHGDANATIGLLDRDIIREVAPGVKLVQMSVHASHLVFAAAIAVGMLTRAFWLLQKRI